MTTLTIEPPESVLAALRLSPADISAELRLAAAATWHENGKISQEVAGLCRTDFLLALARMGKDSFHVDLDELDRELARD